SRLQQNFPLRRKCSRPGCIEIVKTAVVDVYEIVRFRTIQISWKSIGSCLDRRQFSHRKRNLPDFPGPKRTTASRRVFLVHHRSVQHHLVVKPSLPKKMLPRQHRIVTWRLLVQLQKNEAMPESDK